MTNRSPSRVPPVSQAAPEIQEPEADPYLRGVWYVALPSTDLKRGKMMAQTLLGEPVLFARQTDGAVFAIKDLCPHRGVPLRFGDFDGETVGCAYHGWRFNGGGNCAKIPSLVEQADMNVERIRCGAYDIAERQGLIWIFMPDPAIVADKTPPPPELFPGFEERDPTAAIRLVYNCNFDDAAFGMMDPAHVAHVHRAWWLKRKAADLRLKEKHFEPYGIGWRMKPHRIANVTPFHRLLGSEVTTEIQIRLPGFRIELIYGERHRVLNLLAITPIDGKRTQMLQAIWATIPGFNVLSPLVARAATRFLKQDADIIDKQNEGYKYARPQVLIADADTQMKWWMKIKREWRAHREEGRDFENPATEATLRFRS